jgi:predicted branched-subunit amino acid permease
MIFLWLTGWAITMTVIYFAFNHKKTFTTRAENIAIAIVSMLWPLWIVGAIIGVMGGLYLAFKFIDTMDVG